MQDVKIDLVYLWVDGNDKEWQDEKEKWAEKLKISNNIFQNNCCRFIDNDELRYSLRSAEMYAPWINKIFIITNGQRPKWLNINHPKIKIIEHKEIMPNTALPTFNSQAIVACIDKIEELSEYYLLANDDTFFAQKVIPEDFFDENGNPYVNLRPHIYENPIKENDTYTQSILFSINLIKKKFNIKENLETLVPCHCIDAYRKSYLKECKQLFEKEYDATIHAQFRTNLTIQSMLLKLYMVYQKNCQLIKNPMFCEQEGLNKVDNLYVSLESYDKVKKIIKSKSPKLLCINDCSYSTDENRKELKILLNELFYKKQAWEILSDFQIKPIFTGNYLPIVFAFNESYCKYFSVALQSIIEHSQEGINYDLIVLTSGISEISKKLLFKQLPNNFSLRFFDITNVILEQFSNIFLKEIKYWSVDIYYRIFIPIIMQQYEKVLYLDSDIVVEGNLEDLFFISFENKELIAISDTTPHILEYENYQERKKQILNVLKLKNETQYFNSGVLLFNISKINLAKYTENLQHTLLIDEFLFPDQDILNILFEGKTRFVSSKWNYCCGELIYNPDFIEMITGSYKEDFLKAKENPQIVHYTSPRKPWNNQLNEHFDKFWQYARKSPFYEEILYNMNKETTLQIIVENVKYTNLYLQIQNGKKIAFWGASLFLEEFIKRYDLINDNIVGIIDKNPSKKGKFIKDYRIFAPEELKSLNPDEIIVTIVNSAKERAEEVRMYLKKEGYNNITVKTL